MSRIHWWIERRTRTVFGTIRSKPRAAVPVGTFYARIGRGGGGLCLVEIGTSSRYFYFDRTCDHHDSDPSQARVKAPLGDAGPETVPECHRAVDAAGGRA